MSNVDKGTAKQRMLDRIDTAKILNRLLKCSVGEIKMLATEIRAAEIVLKKIIPDLKSSESVVKVQSVTTQDEAIALIASLSENPEEIWASVRKH